MGTTAALVDDHSIFREGLKLLFDLHGDPRVVGEAATSRDALEMVSSTHPDLVVLDMLFPNDASGIALAHRLLKRNPSLRILFLSMVKDETQKDRTPAPEKVTRLFEETKKRGLLIGRGGLWNNTLRIAPALNVGAAEIDEALKILGDSLAEFAD